MYKQDLALNNLQGLICNKTQPTNQESILPSIYPLDDRRRDWFMSSAGPEFDGKHKQTWFRIWNYVSKSISYEDNRLT